MHRLNSHFRAWIQASRLPSQSYIFFPLLFGQGLWYAQSGQFSWGLAALTHLYGLFIQLYIVYANDYADFEVDKTNRTYNLFSGGSRVLVEGKLDRRQLGLGIAMTMVLSGAVGLWLTLGWGRWVYWPLLVSSWALLWLYSFSPGRFSYRGGGEFLQMLGCGLVLPLMGYSMQKGTLSGFPWPVLSYLLPVQLAAAMTAALPDEPSDRAGGKCTLAVRLGSGPVKVAIIALYGFGFSAFVLWAWGRAGLPAMILILAQPLFALAGMLVYFFNGPAGTRRCNVFVALSIAATVFFTAATGIHLFFRNSSF
jgi:1,4-dihydroxy-2-naphthoate octaprenyltransferase